MTNDLPHTVRHNALSSYITGYILSLVLTALPLLAFYVHQLNNHQFPTHETLGLLFIGAAVVQLFVQLWFFLHLNHETRPRWNTLFAALAVFMVATIVIGSLWIMAHLQHPDLSRVYTNEVITPQHEQD